MPETRVLKPRPPFSFGQALAFLQRFPPTLADQAIVGEVILGAARVRGQTLSYKVEDRGTRHPLTLYPGWASAGEVEPSRPTCSRV